MPVPWEVDRRLLRSAFARVRWELDVERGWERDPTFYVQETLGAVYDLLVPPPPFSDGIFPCTTCHNKDMPPNRTRRTLSDMHTDIVLKHDAEHRWCLDCHDADHRDQLHLASGDPVPFEESYRLCGQCHGEKYRDWRAGVHGRRVGQWNGAKRYLLCVNCHSPHEPRFKSMAPQPGPIPPRRPR